MKLNRQAGLLIASHLFVLVVGIALGMWALSSDGHGHGHEEESFGSEYLNLLTDPAHFFYELTLNIGMDIIVIGLLIPLVWRSIRKHDEEYHGGRHDHGSAG
jgi:hypothetical protein